MEQISLMKPKERLIITYDCEGCGRTVQKKQMQLTGGPNKGEWITVDVGCKCEDIRLADQEKKRAERLKTQKMLKYFNNHSLLNRPLQKATFENYEPTTNQLQEAKQKAMDYVDNFTGKENLLFSGSYGTGKSHLSVSITKELMKKGYTSVFISVPKLLTKIKDTYNNDGPTEDELLGIMSRVDLLVIDDIGAEHKTAWSTPKLFEIFDERSGKATIFTTNLNSEQLTEWVGERNFSRMMEDTKPIKMNGRDYRRKEF
ncbi:ATP-binding protein [Virgibacillus salexigens]|uniref:ATP-binding protein n=1 Tax=Virgibacillus salexigens TaxID=61016 RepID=UPI0030814867